MSVFQEASEALILRRPTTVAVPRSEAGVDLESSTGMLKSTRAEPLSMDEPMDADSEAMQWFKDLEAQGHASQVILLTRWLQEHHQDVEDGDHGALVAANKLGQLYWTDGAYDKAILLFRKVYEVVGHRYPDEYGMLLMATSNYLQCLAALGRYDESVEVVQHVAPRNPPPGVMDDDLADRLLFIGRLMTYLGEFELSIRAFQALIDGSSEGVVSRKNVGKAKRSASKATIGLRTSGGREVSLARVKMDLDNGKLPFRN